MPRQLELEYDCDCRPVHHTQAWRALIPWGHGSRRASLIVEQCFLRLAANEMLGGDLPCSLDDG